jgi:uncharacterized protein (DUF983 family)
VMCPTKVAPPACCQPPMSDEVWAARTARLAAARKRAYERMPERCPACGDARVYPTFLEPDEWGCDAAGCYATWRVTDGR